MLLSDLRVEGGQLVLAGKGFGHGVGLCQWGAKLLAEQGKSPEEIVQFYHRNVEIQKRSGNKGEIIREKNIINKSYVCFVDLTTGVKKTTTN